MELRRFYLFKLASSWHILVRLFIYIFLLIMLIFINIRYNINLNLTIIHNQSVLWSRDLHYKTPSIIVTYLSIYLIDVAVVFVILDTFHRLAHLPNSFNITSNSFA